MLINMALILADPFSDKSIDNQSSKCHASTYLIEEYTAVGTPLSLEQL